MLSGAIYEKMGAGFPYGTFAINATGCFIIGLIMEMTETRYAINPVFKMFLTVGVLGGYTTFSSYSFETLAMARDGMMLKASLYSVGSLVTGLFAAWAGMVAGRLV